jgi:hypothetical protein
MPKTLNKDGTPRKIGSGKTKGAGCYSPITLTELKNLISDDVQILVSRVWLRSVGGLSEDGATSKILPDQPSAPPPSKVSTTEDDRPKKESSPPKEEPPAPEYEGDYEPPPLFAVGPSKFRQY